ncbi:MAG: hypothetical protein M1378_00275 [Bacteroidetes bacterium]|nr:hypothetical protein [Bacteroidota bacterium]
MTITKALKNDNNSLRLEGGGRWLVWDSALEMRTVYEHKYRAKSSTVVYRGDDEQAAVAALLAD